ncbi:DUF4872 domain-containing protein [Nonomuraea sp. NPDC046570]|uniref:DUF4872 domain-containing protein n=1 Tax=Nonomuraea sp. NPDC046570 TaxID=3155255 RepID=UPI00340C8291
MALEVLMAAWGGHRKGRHRLIAVTGRPDDLDLPAAIRDAVTTTYRHLTGPVLGHAFDVNFGLSGMRKLAAQLGDPRKGWRARFATPEKLVSALTRLRLCLEEEYGAPGAMRPLYAGFLDEAAPLVSPGLAEAAGLYREAGGCWSAMAAAADSMAEDVVRGDPLDGLDELASLAARAVAVEERAAEALQRSGAVRASVD